MKYFLVRLNFSLFHIVQCGNVRIILPLRFYVKSNSTKINFTWNLRSERQKKSIDFNIVHKSKTIWKCESIAILSVLYALNLDFEEIHDTKNCPNSSKLKYWVTEIDKIPVFRILFRLLNLISRKIAGNC